MELARAVDHSSRGLTMHVNKVHSARTLALVARDLGTDENWLADLALDMEPQDGLPCNRCFQATALSGWGA